MPNLAVVIKTVTEQTALDAAGKVTKVLNVQFTVGPHGPFTEITTRADLDNGTALRNMQQFAASLANLPQAS